jgi:hypothetical protein
MLHRKDTQLAFNQHHRHRSSAHFPVAVCVCVFEVFEKKGGGGGHNNNVHNTHNNDLAIWSRIIRESFSDYGRPQKITTCQVKIL